ncbi:MAG: hypothetical protein COA58_02890 [Bacteroidetes bacterium]|nr:MAG: hypothetical protein COA58_02890 [Bacteroidota bacterium]
MENIVEGDTPDLGDDIEVVEGSKLDFMKQLNPIYLFNKYVRPALRKVSFYAVRQVINGIIYKVYPAPEIGVNDEKLGVRMRLGFILSIVLGLIAFITTWKFKMIPFLPLILGVYILFVAQSALFYYKIWKTV